MLPTFLTDTCAKLVSLPLTSTVFNGKTVLQLLKNKNMNCLLLSMSIVEIKTPIPESKKNKMRQVKWKWLWWRYSWFRGIYEYYWCSVVYARYCFAVHFCFLLSTHSFRAYRFNNSSIQYHALCFLPIYSNSKRLLNFVM